MTIDQRLPDSDSTNHGVSGNGTAGEDSACDRTLHNGHNNAMENGSAVNGVTENHNALKEKRANVTTVNSFSCKVLLDGDVPHSQKISDGATKYKYKSNFKSTLSQLLATLVESLLVVVMGTQCVMPTIVLGALRNNPDEELSLNDYDAAWLGSILFLCQPVGSIVSGFLCERFGRRGSMALINIPFIVGWILLHYAASVTGLFAAALAMGMGIGFCEAPIAAYLGEIGEPHLRGSLLSIMISATSFGYLSTYFLGSIMPWRTFALVNLIYPVTTMILFTQIPESPVWLVHKGRLKEAQKALGWLRGFLQPNQVQEEFDRMVKHIESSKSASPTEKKLNDFGEVTSSERSGIIGKLLLLRDPMLFQPVRLIFLTFVFTQCMCLQAFKPYLVGILKTFQFPVNPKWVLIIIGLMSFVGSTMPLFIFRFTGKRNLILYNQFICCVTVFGLGIYCSFFNDTLSSDSPWRWLPIVFFAIVFFSSSMGIMNVPWMLMGEVFPIRWRSFATGICGAWAYCVTFVTARLYLPMESVLSLSGMFYLYGAIGILGFFYFYFFLPETEGKTLETIESYFTPYHDKKEKFSRPKR
nr:PREDICTED: facilitated trehalose transporter Tret1-like [Bemisia tabaci]XP_018906326.1 PREDICTED: facilitated trehalose transporter Tret1-like [Bemisia tabaci]XP_018906327.1 PREDICTED: facilitated trehalose transporter Tret1-like [Bemisia tabaci]